MSDTPQQRKETFLEEVRDLVEKYIVQRGTFRKNLVLKNYELDLPDKSIKELLEFEKKYYEEGPTGINLDGLHRWTIDLWNAQTPAFKGIRADEQGPTITRQDMRPIDNTIFGKHDQAVEGNSQSRATSQPARSNDSQRRDGQQGEDLKEWKNNTSPEQRKKEFLKAIQGVIEKYLIGGKQPSSKELKDRFGLYIPDVERWEKKPKKYTTYIAWLRKNISRLGYTRFIKEYAHKWIIQGVWLQQSPEYRITQDNTLKEGDLAPIDALLTKFAEKARSITEEKREKGGLEKNAEHAEDHNPPQKKKEGDEDESNQEGLFFYIWWAFKDESVVKELNDKSGYPRRIGKGSRPRYEEEPTKDKNVMDTNEKPHGEAVDAVYLGIGGTTQSEVPFEDSEKIPPQELEEFPVIGLGVAIAQRKDFPEPVNFRTMKASRKDQIVYEFLPKEDLRWKWQWRRVGGKKKRKLKVKVVDAQKVHGSPVGLDLMMHDQALTDEQVKAILEDKDNGIEKANITLNTNDTNTNVGKTHKDGTLEVDSDQVPAGGFWPTAKKTSWFGKNGKRDAIAVHPWPPGSQLVLKEDLTVIIPMDPGDPKKPELRIAIANNDDHPRPKEKKWGQAEMTSFEPGKTVNSQHVFQIIGTNVSNLKNNPFLICYLVKVEDKNPGKVNRTTPPFGKISVERQDVWQSYFVTKKGDKASQWKPFNAYYELPKQLGNTIIATSITVPKGASGKYAIWAFLAEGQPGVNKLEDLARRSFDFNYYEFKVDNGEVQDDSKSTKKDERKASKDLKKLGEEFKKMINDADDQTEASSFNDDQKEDCASLLDDLVTFKDTVTALVQSDSTQKKALEEAIKLGIWGKKTQKIYHAKDVPTTRIASHLRDFKGLKGLQQSLSLEFGDTTLHDVNKFKKDKLKMIKDLVENLQAYHNKNLPATPSKNG